MRRLVLGFGLLCLLTQALWARTWSDATGKYRLEAQFLRIEGKSVLLKRDDDGREVKVPLERLSESDRRFADEQSKKAAPLAEKPASGAPRSSKPSVAQRVLPRQALKRRVQASFEETPLEEAVKTLEKQAKTNIVLDRRALDDVGIGPSVPVTAKVSGPLEKALREVCDQLQLTFVVAYDVILLTTPQRTNAWLQLSVYRLKQRMSLDELADAIRSTIVPNSWDVVGGAGSLAWLKPNTLVINQSWTALQQIDGAYDHVLERVQVPANDQDPLARTISVDFRNLPLGDAMDFIADRLGTKIKIDDRALNDAAITSDTPVSLEVVDVRGDSVLQLILGAIGLAWARETDEILVSTSAALAADTRPVNYDIAGLTEADDSRQFIETITSTIQPTAWSEVGGPASIRQVGRGRIVVNAHDPLHRQIERLFATLRGKR